MKKHSLRGYLRRQTTEKLDSILEFCLQGDNYKKYDFVIMEVMKILEERYVPNLDTETAKGMRERLLQYKPKD